LKKNVAQYNADARSEGGVELADAPHGTTFNAETAERPGFLCGFREFCVDRRR